MSFVPNKRYWQLRRGADVCVASVALCIALPILLLAAIAIVLDDGGPVLLRQRRVGRFERLFTIYKLRTMRVDQCIDRISPGAAGDPRVTRVGRWLRRTSIDELPQLWNVLLGDMSLVGPRPEMPFVVSCYEPWQHLRHLAPPGLTGLWQVTCRSRVPLHRPEATALDLRYIEAASLRVDAGILSRTINAVIRGTGAY